MGVEEERPEQGGLGSGGQGAGWVIHRCWLPRKGEGAEVKEKIGARVLDE